MKISIEKDPNLKYTFEESKKLLAQCEIDENEKIIKTPAHFGKDEIYAAEKLYELIKIYGA
jgi:hypothetical protein